jgi:hypothetical protein
MELMHGKWRDDYMGEHTAKFRLSYATPLSQLIYLLYAQVLGNTPYARWMPHHSIDLPHVDL